MHRDAYLKLELARTRRLADNLRDDLSRELIQQYLFDIREEQQKRRYGATLLERSPTI